MAKRDYIITAFGLQHFRINAYQGKLGEQTPTASSGEFEEFENEPNRHMNVGADDALNTSWMGTPIWADLILSYDSRDPGVLIDTLLLDVSQSKNIVTTAISGRNGTVKEYISDGDFFINAKGLITSSSGEYPFDDVHDFLDRMNHNEQLEVVSPYLQLFGIHNIVITDFRMPQQEGFQNVQLFEFNALSETNIVLIEDEETN